ncbi:unnamed protein product [Cylicostephanus goldi]|uniref:Uncharacterized protein n=1 Tax=Cylicostephanus goldi TaxID=71465 RepID=A0A3P6R0T8_CYLGO|nr:unnamed protein product [Cylicostephanus goldi]
MGPTEQKDLPLPLETRPWIEKGLAALKEKDPKPIYRPPQSEKTKQRKTHFAEKTVEHTFFDDLQTSLIVKVNEQPLLSPNNVLPHSILDK